MSDVIYLAAPYSGTQEEVQRRIDLVCIIDVILSAKGNHVISPLLKHFILSYGNIPGDWAFWWSFCEINLKSATKMVVVGTPGWEQSEGVKGEIEIANSLNKPVTIINPKKFFESNLTCVVDDCRSFATFTSKEGMVCEHCATERFPIRFIGSKPLLFSQALKIVKNEMEMVD